MRDTDSPAKSLRHKRKKHRSPSVSSAEDATGNSDHSNEVEQKKEHLSGSDSSPERVKKHKKKKKKHRHKHKHNESDVEEAEVVDLSPDPPEEHVRQRKSLSPHSDREHDGSRSRKTEKHTINREASVELERVVQKRREKRGEEEPGSYGNVRVKREPSSEADDRSRCIQSSSGHRPSDRRPRERPETSEHHASRHYHRREGERPREGDRQRNNEKPREGDRQRENERPREGDRQRENERPREGDRQRENERPREGDRQRENERPREGDRQRENERPREGDRQRENERPREGDRREGERPRQHERDRRHNDDRSNSARNEDRREANPKQRRGSEERSHQRSEMRPQRGRGGRGGAHGNRVRRNETEETFEWGRKADNVKEEPVPPAEKEKPNFAPSGKLTEEANTFNGVVIKYSEPPEARKPRRRWRFYPFKGEKALQTLYIHRQSSYLIGRDRKIADIPVDHPSCSKQHAALQYRLVPFERENGTTGKRVRPYIIDLESANGTYVNNNKIDPKKYVELLERDVVKFGFSSREYVLLHEHSKDDDYDDVGELDESGEVTADA